jgi:formamidopyrimidine-DNA glycosylase
MPELPEVETMARELRRSSLGATISQTWTDWRRPFRHHRRGRLPRARCRGRRIVAVRRRAKWLVIELDQGALVIQVKMTGQLAVVPATKPAIRMSTPPGRSPTAARCACGTCASSRASAHTTRGAQATLDQHGSGAARTSFSLPPPAATAWTAGGLKPLTARPGLPGRRRQHLRDEALWRARTPTRCAMPTTCAAAIERRLYQALRGVLQDAIDRSG